MNVISLVMPMNIDISVCIQCGKKAGEFYTPQQVSKILAKFVNKVKKNLKNVFDTNCGSGSLLLRFPGKQSSGSYWVRYETIHLQLAG
jgi:hypothetical protein